MSDELKFENIEPGAEYTPPEVASALNLNLGYVLFLMRERLLEYVEYSPRVRRIPGKAIIAYRERKTRKAVVA